MRINKIITIWIGILAVAAGAIIAINRNSNPAAVINSPTPQIDSQNSVDVSVSLLPGSGTLDFRVEMNTHSVELNNDMAEAGEMTDSGGKIYKPLAWEGSGPEGHHRGGILSFEMPPANTRFVELKLKDIGGVKERVFKWDLNR